jgi:hypothetical protein
MISPPRPAAAAGGRAGRSCQQPAAAKPPPVPCQSRWPDAGLTDIPTGTGRPRPWPQHPSPNGGRGRGTPANLAAAMLVAARARATVGPAAPPDRPRQSRRPVPCHHRRDACHSESSAIWSNELHNRCIESFIAFRMYMYRWAQTPRRLPMM